MSDERADPNDPLLAVARKALGLVDMHGGVDSRDARSRRPTRKMDEALVELMVQNVRAGYVTPPGFLPRPDHLPDDDRELRVLRSSKVERDQSLRSDLGEWVAINRRITGQAAVTLRNAITAVRIADTLLNEGDDNDTTIAEWKGEIESHLYRSFKVTVYEAPENAFDLGLWCEAKLADLSPVPEWLRDGGEPRPLFEAKPRSTMRVAEMRVEKASDDE